MRRQRAAGLVALAAAALAPAAQAWQGAAGPDYYTGDNTLTLTSLQSYPSAVCNDGTPASYYFSPGSDPNLWVLYLEGGYWCVDQASCEGRAQNEPQETSSNGWPEMVQAGGIFSTDTSQNPWAQANMAYVGYCSSDGWMGNSEAFGFQFRGQSILAAVIQDLKQYKGLGSGAKLLFSGCSAGARGVMANLDAVAASLSGVDVKGFIDSGYWVDAQPADTSTTESLLEETQQVYSMVDASNLVPASCAAAYSGEEYKCLFGQYRFPYIETPYFLNEAQFDSFQVRYNLGGDSPSFGFQVDWVNDFQQLMLQEISTLPTSKQTQSGVFSSVCLLHCVSNGPDFWTVTVNGQSLQSALSEWYFKGTAPVKVIDTSCTGWACHSNCKGEEQPALKNGPNGAGGGGLGGGPPHPGQFDLPPVPPGESWEAQVAAARKSAAASAGETPAQYQAQMKVETQQQKAQEQQQKQQAQQQGQSGQQSGR